MTHWLAIAALLAGSAASVPAGDKSKVSRATIADAEKNLDKGLLGVWPDDRANLVGLTQGLYIGGYGAVFTGEIDLAPSGGITPFHPEITRDEAIRTHTKKVQRLPRLKEAMRDLLISIAASLDTVPPDEQITLGLSLLIWRGETTSGLPAQIVMHAPKKTLLALRADKAGLASAVTMEEF
jgi:hypothetical protein